MLGTQIIIIIIVIIIIIIIIIIITINNYYYCILYWLEKLLIFACDCFLIEFVRNRVFENYYSA